MGTKFKKFAFMSTHLLLSSTYLHAAPENRIETIDLEALAPEYPGEMNSGIGLSGGNRYGAGASPAYSAADDAISPVSYEVVGPVSAPARQHRSGRIDHSRAATRAPDPVIGATAGRAAPPTTNAPQYRQVVPAGNGGAIAYRLAPLQGNGQMVIQPGIAGIAGRLPYGLAGQQVIAYPPAQGQVVAIYGAPGDTGGWPVVGYRLQPGNVLTYQVAPVIGYLPAQGTTVTLDPRASGLIAAPYGASTPYGTPYGANASAMQQDGRALPKIVGRPLPPGAQDNAERRPRYSAAPGERNRTYQDRSPRLPASPAPIESRSSREVLPDLPTASFRGLVIDVRKKGRTTPAMRVSGKTGAPIGYVRFCRENRSECGERTSSPGIVKLTRALWNEVVAINAFVNGAVEPVTDDELYNTPEKWTYPTSGRGDCEDYVLLKRRLLMERGWPASALLITVARDENGGGHAVLTARTDQGDFILDNRENKVLAWYQTPYRYIKRQSEYEARLWLTIEDDRPYNVGSIRR